jgi:DNA repair protein SbcC/Rad50
LKESDQLAKSIDAKKTQKAGLAIQWSEINEKDLVFNDSEFNCPACHRPLEAHDIDTKKAELTENFNTDKSRKLADIEQKGSALKEDIITSEKRLAEIANVKEGIDSETINLNDLLNLKVQENEAANTSVENEVAKILASSEPYKQAHLEIAELEKVQSSNTTAPANTELREEKLAIQSEINNLNLRLADEDRIAQTNLRIEELSKQEADLAQQLADLEGKEFLIEKFNRVKVDTIQARVNSMFTMVKFKMFETQINGGEVECCEALINGVPFSDANNASKINAGLDIINTLCKHYNVYAPIFIDNRESVNDLIDCDSQIVNLIVSRDEKLRVA